MKTTNIGQVYTRKGVGGLYTTRPTILSIRFSKGLSWTLRKLIEKKEKTKDMGRVTVESAILGNVHYDCKYRGKKRGWVNTIAFDDDQTLAYEEMRHGLTLAIFALTGGYAAIQVSFDLKSAEWRLDGGRKMFDCIQRAYETVGLEGGLVSDLSRVVTRDIETYGGNRDDS